MAPRKKLTDEERKSKNKPYCKDYRRKHSEKYKKNDRERKKLKRLQIEIENPQLHKIKKENNRLRMKESREKK